MSSISQNRFRDGNQLSSSPSLDAKVVSANNVDEAKKTPPIDNDSGVSEQEAAALRAEKINAIRKAIASGAYDSDELLGRAMDRMMESLEDSDDSE